MNMYEISLFFTYSDAQKLEVWDCGFNHKNTKRFIDKLMHTLAILINAYLIGFPVALNQAKGTSTNASRNRVQIIKVKYFLLINKIASKASLKTKVTTKNKSDVTRIEKEEVPITSSGFFSLL